MTRILPSALSWEKSWRTPANTATTTTISTKRSNVLITLNLFCGQDYEQRAMSYQEKMGTDICFDWIDDMTTVLYHQPSAIPVSHLYTNSSVVVSTYFIIAGRRLPLVSNLLSTPTLRSSIFAAHIGIIILCIILSYNHRISLWQFKPFNANAVPTSHFLALPPLCHVQYTRPHLRRFGKSHTCTNCKEAKVIPT